MNLIRHKRTKNYVKTYCCGLQIAKRQFIEPEHHEYLQADISPAFENNNIALVFATDDIYANYLGVTITSVLASASDKNNYDIIIFDGGISRYKAYLLSSLAQNRKNVSIRFFNILDYVKKWESLFYGNGHITIAACYRFFIPDICHKYKRILYLDCDLVAQSDVAELYNYDLKDKNIGAVVDKDEHMENLELSEYLQQTLPFLRADSYFNSGVILFDIAKCQKDKISQHALELLKEYKKLKFTDQDILNILLQGKVEFLPFAWNSMWGPKISSINNFNISPLENRKIIHYTSSTKPWDLWPIPLAEVFWKYARISPFYEALVFRKINQALKASKANLLVLKLARKFTWGSWRKALNTKLNTAKDSLKAINSL